MELEDFSSGDDIESTPVVVFDEVRPFTPPSSPETESHDHHHQSRIEHKPKSKSRRSNTKSRSNDSKFVELESEEDSDNEKQIAFAMRPKPIQVKPKKSPHFDQDCGELDTFIPDTERVKNKINDKVEKPKREHEEKPKSKSKHKRKSKRTDKEKKERKQPVNIWPGDLKGIFDIDGTTSDVVLDQLGLSWSSMAMGITTTKKKSKKKSKDSTDNNESHLQFDDVIGVKIKRQRKGKQVEGEGICIGIAVQTYEIKENGRLKEKMYIFGNPSQDICLEWSRRIQGIIEGFESRPKKLLVFLQPYAGKKNSRSIYKKEILPMFEMAGITEEYFEVNHNEHIKHEMVHLDLTLYDCVVCVGGDGTVTKVISHMMTKIQKDEGVDMRLNVTPVKSPVPIGIIPTGTLNQICHTVQGVEDPITSAIHIILGHRYPSDICSTYSEGSFHGWSFNSHYGFFGSVLPFLSRYTRLGDKKIDASFMKALTKSKFRSYECEIQYVPYTEDTSHHPNNNQKCRQGCSRCSGSEDSNHNKPTLDEVQTLQLNESGNSSTLIDMSKNSPWQLTKGDYASVSVLSTPALSDLAPQGMSKFTHVADGCMDLIMVKNVDKKEFLRYLKRHGNHKDQLNLPFVEAIRCSEIIFHARSPDGWNHKDYGFNEILDEVKKGENKVKHGLHRAESIEVIDDLDTNLPDSDEDGDGEQNIMEFMPAQNEVPEGSKKPRSPKKSKEKTKEKSSEKSKEKMKKSKSKEEQKTGDEFCVGQTEGGDNMGYVNENFQEEDEENNKMFVSRDDSVRHASSKGSAGGMRTLQEKLAQDSNLVLHVTPKYRPTLVEQEHARRMKSQRKHDEKKKAKSDAKLKSIWNCDNETVTSLDLHFRVHRGLIQLCGSGVPVQYDPDEVKMGCLAIF